MRYMRKMSHAVRGGEPHTYCKPNQRSEDVSQDPLRISPKHAQRISQTLPRHPYAIFRPLLHSRLPMRDIHRRTPEAVWSRNMVSVSHNCYRDSLTRACCVRFLADLGGGLFFGMPSVRYGRTGLTRSPLIVVLVVAARLSCHALNVAL